jgi:CheY-like chemotaxis protein
MVMKKRRVLLVDKDVSTVWTVGRQLLGKGFSVIPLTDGEEGLKLLDREKFDFLIANIQMPEVSGLELLNHCHRCSPATRTIMVGDYGSSILKEMSLKNRADLYIEKPIDLKFLIDAVSQPSAPEAFSGAISNVDLLDYLQFILFSKQRKLLVITSRAGEKGKIYFQDGDVMHAECSTKKGEEAFYNCLLFEGGSFFEFPGEELPERSITVPGEFLLMEAARKKDELKDAGEKQEHVSVRNFANMTMATAMPVS